jgi:hypothetical protein
VIVTDRLELNDPPFGEIAGVAADCSLLLVLTVMWSIAGAFFEELKKPTELLLPAVKVAVNEVLAGVEVLVPVTLRVGLDLPPNLRQPVKTRFSANGELSHGYFA